MAKFTWDHIHIRTPDPEATAQWFEKMLGAEIIRTMQQGAPRIDIKLGGANVFLAPVKAGDGVNPPPTTPYQGLDHFGLSVTGIDAIAADLKAKGVKFTREPTTVRPGTRVVLHRGPAGRLDRTARPHGLPPEAGGEPARSYQGGRGATMDTKTFIRSPTPTRSGASCSRPSSTTSCASTAPSGREAAR